ncbi:MAG: hypothetical protein N2746_11640 [Deltaproteobacteria bacterium]|nr:hypothetical protein [Deltaproteobacteria bacterium]
MRRVIITTTLITIFIILVKVAACTEDDIGKSCEIKIPIQSCSNNIAVNDIASDCIHHWCLSYLGSAGFCSKTCISNADCPSGFRCLKGFASLDPELKNTSFCVPKQSLECIAGTQDVGQAVIEDVGE